MSGSTAQVLDGKATAAAIKAELAVRVAALRERGVVPGLGTVLVGEDPGSQAYVAGKHRDCAEVGIASIREDLPADASEADVLAAVDRLNADPACTGYIVQLPLPKGVDTNLVLERIDPDKDADGLHPTNLGRLVLRVNEPLTSPLPCTPRGILELMARYGLSVAGKHVVVLGRGTTVGRSIGLLLTRREHNATVTLTHTGTADLASHVRMADVVVAAAGVPGLVRAEDVKPGAVVLDVGIGFGDSLTTAAAADSAVDVIGADVHTPGIASTLARIESMGLSNVRLVHGDALVFLDRLQPGSLAHVRIYFPDPWPKARHRHRRITSAANVDRFVALLRTGGTLHVATDKDEYAAATRRTCDAHVELAGGVIDRPDWRPVTRYEAKGVAVGRIVTDLLYRKVGPG